VSERMMPSAPVNATVPRYELAQPIAALRRANSHSSPRHSTKPPPRRGLRLQSADSCAMKRTEGGDTNAATSGSRRS
jgi:hypothetical protein